MTFFALLRFYLKKNNLFLYKYKENSHCKKIAPNNMLNKWSSIIPEVLEEKKIHILTADI